ncbi:inducible nitrate reductase [NADH] 1-like isoform X2 [Penaeus japonicus]|uniref:inducible nitrate reductase [NADH] 1-like isoform X2 n=1 Tax=Penaeus japonicus TaxID=27405 RepID=UPI001C70BFBF|nr:inducible nitrate reductase [NADH] 1-like isoform X2 [Penaeus japonicus]
MGMHGNQSGPLIVEGKIPLDRMVGPPGDGGKNNDECGIVYFTSLASAWNGIALACLDVAKKHVTRKAHADMGLRVCDYPSVQDYFGECVISTNSSRGLLLLLLQAVDDATQNNKWALHSDHSFLPRTPFQHWLWQAKFVAAKNVVKVSDKMLFACGGSGYRTELGLERLLRDGKSGWVMGPTNEVIRQLVGKSVLIGFECLDPWQERADQRVLQHEMQKLTLEEKTALAEKLLQEVEAQKEGESRAGAAAGAGAAATRHPYQDSDFDNPFHTRPPACVAKITTPDGAEHDPALHPDAWTTLKLLSRADLTGNMALFTFALPKSTDHTGCLPGQYVVVRLTIDGKEHRRYFSPVSRPSDFGRLELVLRFESSGVMSKAFQDLKPGDQLDFQGPCGGLEYEANQLTALTVLASGAGVTPGLQLVRCVAQEPQDKTNITLLYFAETVDDFLYKEELDRYCEKDSRVRVVYNVQYRQNTTSTHQ